MSGLHVELVPIAGIGEDTREAWAALEPASVEPNPFFGPDMATAAAAHLPLGRSDVLLVVRRDDELELALPLRRVRRYRQVPIPTFRAWGHPHAFLDTPLVRDRDPEGAWDAALTYLRRRGAGWLSFERLGADGPVRAALDAVLHRRGARTTALASLDRPMVHRRPEPTYLEGRMSSSQRRRLGRFRRRLETELGGPAWVADRAADDLEGAIERFLTLEQGGWKGTSGTALTSTPGGGEFFRQTMLSAGHAGRVQLWELGVGSAVVAGLCAIVGGGGVFHFKTAYDEAHRRDSPGLQLEVEVLGAFHDDKALDWIDSGVTGAGESPSSALYPDSRAVESLLVPLRGQPSHAAAMALKQALAWRADREARRG